jgi:hypothetical protein
MSDILTGLAELTTKDPEGLLPCYCGAPGHLQDVKDYRVYSVKCSRENHHETGWYETPEEAIHEWNSRPRESALIALVQEAAGEIERLRETLGQIASSHHVGNAWAQDKAAQALNRQEIAP